MLVQFVIQSDFPVEVVVASGRFLIRMAFPKGRCLHLGDGLVGIIRIRFLKVSLGKDVQSAGPVIQSDAFVSFSCMALVIIRIKATAESLSALTDGADSDNRLDI